MEDIPVQKAALHCPPLTQVAQVLQDGLRKNFASAEVSVIECPDLRKAPFHLAACGLCGSPHVADVGGTQYLFPEPHKDKIYDINKIAELSGMSPGTFVIGAGAGPSHIIGANSELITNLRTQESNESYTVRVDKKDSSHSIMEKCRCFECFASLNVFLSEGKGGKVLEVKASNRTGEMNIFQCMRESLRATYGEKLMGLGGVMLLKKGRARIHVGPDFNDQPRNTDEELVKWIKFYEMSAPLICLGTMVTQVTDLDLRLLHFHCFSNHGDGGHFREDTTPADAEYLGYFNLGETVVRLDCPPTRSSLGRFN